MKTLGAISIRGTHCTLHFGQYPNGTVAIEARTESNELFATLTTNWESRWEGNSPYAANFPFPAAVIKNYSENEGVLEALEAAGVVRHGGAWMAGTNGTVAPRILTEEWQTIAKQQCPGIDKPRYHRVTISCTVPAELTALVKADSPEDARERVAESIIKDGMNSPFCTSADFYGEPTNDPDSTFEIQWSAFENLHVKAACAVMLFDQ